MRRRVGRLVAPAGFARPRSKRSGMDRALSARLGRPLALAGGAARARGGRVRLAAARLRIALLAALGDARARRRRAAFLRHSSLAAVAARAHQRRARRRRRTDRRRADARRARHEHARRQARRAARGGRAVPRRARPAPEPKLPARLRIHVIEQPPVAVLLAAGARTAVAADGVVARARARRGTLPSVHIGAPSTPCPGSTSQTRTCAPS